MDKELGRKIRQAAKIHIRESYKVVRPSFKHILIDELTDFAKEMIKKYGAEGGTNPQSHHP